MDGWTEAQMQMVARTVQHEIEDSRLAQKVIPEYKLPGSARPVPANTFDQKTGGVDDVTQLALLERQVPFSPTRAQAEDEDIPSALVIIRRAAQRLGQDHDPQAFRAAIRDKIGARREIAFQPCRRGRPGRTVGRRDGSGDRGGHRRFG